MAKVTAKVMAKVMAKVRAGQYSRLRHSSDTQTERRTAGVMFEQGDPPPPPTCLWSKSMTPTQ